MRLLPIATALGMALAVSTAQAATISYSDSISTTVTNFSGSFTLPQFDTVALNGTLTSIKFTLSGNVTGVIKFENLDGAPATITSNLTATLTLFRPGGPAIVISTPVASFTDAMPAFDTNVDFGGSSGKTYTSVSASDSDTATLTSAPDLGLFIGAGTITLPFTATGASSATGAGNVVSQFSTNADGQVTIEYTYTPTVTVPEPLSLSLLGAGLLGLGVVRARRKA